jgi:hypothetical protein
MARDGEAQLAVAMRTLRFSEARLGLSKGPAMPRYGVYFRIPFPRRGIRNGIRNRM